MKPCTFAIHSKASEDNLTLAKHLTTALVEHGFTLAENKPELILILGGDGSLMRSVHLYHGEGRYLLLNTGHLGFYADREAEEIEGLIQDILTKEPKVEYLPVYQATIDGKEEFFINDFAVQSGGTCWLEISIQDDLLTEIRANGIVVSTPIGTTGYLTSLGSPVVIGNPKIYQFAVISPCYNRLSINPINKAILAADQVLKVRVSQGDVQLYLDGQFMPGRTGESFTFSYDGKKSVSLLHFKEMSQAKRLRKNISGKED